MCFFLKDNKIINSNRTFLGKEVFQKYMLKFFILLLTTFYFLINPDFLINFLLFIKMRQIEEKERKRENRSFIHLLFSGIYISDKKNDSFNYFFSFYLSSFFLLTLIEKIIKCNNEKMEKKKLFTDFLVLS